MTKARCKTLAIVAGIFLAQTAWAEEGTPLFSLSGFGTLGAVYHDRKGVEFRRDISVPNGAKDGELSFAQDSMLGVQATARPDSQFEATLQLVSRHSIGGDFQPQATWAYAKYKPAEELSIRAGRLGIELYLQGDSAEIGYANLSIRQPIIFYPRTHDGLDVEYTRPLGTGTLRLKGSLGVTVGKLMGSSSSDPYDHSGSKALGLILEYARAGWTGRLSAGELSLKDELSGEQFTTLKSNLSLAPNGAEILAGLAMKNRRVNFVSAALAYDSGPLQGTASYSVTSSSNWADTHAFFTHLGYRLGNCTPYLIYSRQHTARKLAATGIPWGLSAATDALNQGVALAQANLMINQSDVAAGLRYDISRNTALKFQVDRIRYKDPSSIVDPTLSGESVEYRATRKLSLISMALEFVF
ncbi:MAG: porin [Azonexus sp.]